jgi:SpoVK/Ycf46/Vps4 family AAA+-type ATPase
MAAADQIKSLIKAFGDGDEDRFYASAMQIAASEARQGHVSFAQELKNLIESSKKNRSLAMFDSGKTIHISPQKRELNELLDIFQPRIKLGDMVLNPEVKVKLENLIAEQKEWELLHHHNLSPKRKLLLIGPPGTGKTMTAQAIAGELGVPVFIIRLDGILSKYMGESIAKLRMIFDIMPGQRGVYLFDEFDSIGTHRHHGYEIGEIKRVLNSFLINIEKDKSNSIIIAATNMPDALDKALFRRFDDIISYPLPHKVEIIAAIKKNITGFAFSGRVSYEKLWLAAKGLNYSDIKKACEETIKEMILGGRKLISNEYLAEALKSKQS